MISIITPSYNQGNYIERTILSVLTQNIADLEYVVMDGGSQDETLSILERYATRLRYISESDQGQTHAINKALRITSGELIGWVNSDDIFYPKTCQTVINFFNSHPEVDILYGDANHIDQNDRIIAPYPTEPWKMSRLKQTCFLSQPAVFFRRRVLDDIGFLNENLSFCMDYEFWLRAALKGMKFAYLPQVLAGSRLYPQTKTMSSPEKATEETLMMLRKQLLIIPNAWLINLAIMQVKRKTNFRMPQLSFIFKVLFLSITAAFHWNGLAKGFRSCVTLPFVMMRMFFNSKKI